MSPPSRRRVGQAKPGRVFTDDPATNGSPPDQAQPGRTVGETRTGAFSEQAQPRPVLGAAASRSAPEHPQPGRATEETATPSPPERAQSGRVRSPQPSLVTAHALLAGHRSALIVEDNPWLSSVLADALVGDHYRVLPTASPRVADRLARAYRPDVIVLDLELPEAAGLGLLAQLKRAPRTRRIPVVALSSQPERTPPDVRQATHAVMSKPFVLPELLAALSEAAGFRPGHPGTDTAA
jgi:CheY-like chemotaxis protein